MTSNKLQYYSQSDFRGGICDQQENLNPKNQVLDSRNCWAPLGTCVRRPGTYGARVITQGVAAGPSTLRAQFTDFSLVGPTGTRTLFGDVASSENITVGDILTPTGYVAFNGGILEPPSLDVAFANVSAYSTFRIITYQAYSDRGWVSIYTNDFSEPTLIDFGALLPADAKADPDGNWIRGIITGVYTGGAFDDTPGTAAGTIDSLGVGYVAEAYVGFDTDTVSQFFGASFLQYSSGTKIIAPYIMPNGAGKYILAINYDYNQLFSPDSSFYNSFTETGKSTYFATSAPPTIAVIPEFNTAYLAVQNQITEIPRTGSPRVAQVNTDSLIVGTDPTLGAPYRADLVPQLSAFPEANFIINFRNLIFAAGIKGQPTLVRWSGAVNEAAYNVWPETSFETLSTAKDNSPITAMAGLGDNLVVFKQNSIWQLIFNGLDDQDLPTFIPQLVVAGVGCIAQGSVQEIRGRLIFLAEDGFYAFDGTPNIKKVSENINATTSRVNAARQPFATAINWRTKYAYLCAVSMDESGTNNFVFGYDYKHGGWWIWEGWDVNCWFQINGVGLQEDVYFVDSESNGFQLGRGSTDNGSIIDNYVLTGRMGQDDVFWKTAREVRLRELNIDGTTQYTLYSDDLQLGVSSKDCRMDSPNETQADPPPDDGCDNVPIRRRERKMPQRLLGEWFQVKAEGFSLLEGINVGYLPESRR